MKKFITVLTIALLSTSVFASIGSERLDPNCAAGKHPMGSRKIASDTDVIREYELLVLAQAEVAEAELNASKGTSADR